MSGKEADRDAGGKSSDAGSAGGKTGGTPPAAARGQGERVGARGRGGGGAAGAGGAESSTQTLMERVMAYCRRATLKIFEDYILNHLKASRTPSWTSRATPSTGWTGGDFPGLPEGV